MAWTSLTFAYGSTLTSAKMTQLYDNLTAMAAGDSGAPVMNGSPSLAAGTVYSGWGNVYDSTVTVTAGSYTEIFNSRIVQAGTYRTSFKLSGSSGFVNHFGRIYKNGVALGTARSTASGTPVEFTEDFAFVKGDTVQLFAYSSSGNTYVKDLKFGLSAITSLIHPPIAAPVGDR